MSDLSWALPPVVRLEDLGALGPPISEGAGEAAAVEPLLDHPGFLAKRYRVDKGGAGRARLDTLIRMPDERPASAPVLRAHTSWPVARIREDGGEATGCVIPQAPVSYLTPVRSGANRAKGPQERYLDIDLVATPNASLARRGLDPLTRDDRLTIGRGLAEVAATLERIGVVYSDWSYSNAFWNPADKSVFVIDVDGCAPGTNVNICQPNWEDPLTSRSEPADAFVDRYRVALLVARCLTGLRDRADVVHALSSTDEPVCSGPAREALLDMILVGRRDHRPSAATLAAVLEGAPYVVFPDRRRITVPPRPQRARTAATTGTASAARVPGQSRPRVSPSAAPQTAAVASSAVASSARGAQASNPPGTVGGPSESAAHDKQAIAVFLDPRRVVMIGAHVLLAALLTLLVVVAIAST